MKLIFIRHGDPDYVHDSLTEKGRHEAGLLGKKMAGIKGDHYYVSPLGRAKETASIALSGSGIVPVECEWLKEFNTGAGIRRPDRPERLGICWDWLPQDWTVRSGLYDRECWADDPVMEAGAVGDEYRSVCEEFDRLLASHGYEREGGYYRAVRPNSDTLVFFCHFGVTCVLLSHLMGVSPVILWQGLAMAPTSLTTVVTEERRPGIASFRALRIGDVSHIFDAGEEPSFSARFCELYTNTDERHD